MQVVCIASDVVWFCAKRLHLLHPIKNQIYTVVDVARKGEYVGSDLVPYDCFELLEFPPQPVTGTLWWVAKAFAQLSDLQSDSLTVTESELAQLEKELELENAPQYEASI